MRTFTEIRLALMALAVSPLFLTTPAMAESLAAELLKTLSMEEPSTAELLKTLESKDASVRMLAEVALTNLASGIAWANAHVKSRGQPAIYCAPDEISLQRDLVADILRRGVTAQPFLAHTYAGQAMLTALQRTFPCKR
jgi:predicted secreted Zn-dependent protease